MEHTKYYIDTEFDGHNGPLISLGLVPEGQLGYHFYIINPVKDQWVIDNVLPVIDSGPYNIILRENELGGALRGILVNRATIVADSPVDIARFCRALSTGPNGEYAPNSLSNIYFEVHDVECYPTGLPGAVQHNAWWDAKALEWKLNGSNL